MKYFFTILVLVLFSGFTIADRLPNQTPENQAFSVDTVIEATGQIDTMDKMDWQVSWPYSLDYNLWGSQTVAMSKYQDSILTNGGKLSENKNWDFNSKNKDVGLYNIEAQKVITYHSTEGSHLKGEEEYFLNTAGKEIYYVNDSLKCVFAQDSGIFPPFCDVISAKSTLTNINQGQISTKGQIRATAGDIDTPAELNHQIAISPDKNSGSSFADGSVKTVYKGNLMEGRGDGITIYPHEVGFWFYGHWISWMENDSVYEPSATNSWEDSTEATGGIKNFQKALSYKSGFRI